MQEALRKASTPLVAALLAATLFVGYTISNTAFATHQPADKVAGSASTVDHVDAATVVLREEMRVSSPSDLIIQLTAECSILTYLETGEEPGGPQESNDFSSATGQVRMWVEIDGRPVPVSTADTDSSQDGVQVDDGKVVFCNRTYQRRVQDSESQGPNMPNDGIDTERDFIRTRTANAFNWLAFDTGAVYDDPSNGNNVLEIEVFAEYVRGPRRCASQDPVTETAHEAGACADAFVGRRSLIIEPTHAANDENTLPTGEGTATPAPTQSAPAPAPSCTPQGNGNNCKG